MQIQNASQPVVEYHAIRGAFGRVQYFLAKTDLRDVAENLQLAPSHNLSFSERIQRVINQDRVKDEIVPYLEHNQLRFFNALVCVLLPDDKDSGEYWDFQEYIDAANRPLGGLGKLRVAKRVGRIVLDGQHRFAALQRLWASHADKNTPLLQMEIAMVFVVIDGLGKVGGEKKVDMRAETIAGARQLFTILNKTARRVDKATLLLIDDSDIQSVITRKIIETKLVEENFVKWVGGLNLQPHDHYFTALHVIRDSVCTLLQETDFNDVMSAANDKIEDAAQGLLSRVPKFECGLAQLVPKLINNLSTYAEWKEMLNTSGVVVQQQPEPTALSSEQREAIDKLRKNNLIFTVAGQRALFAAIGTSFLYGRRDEASFDRLIANADRILRAGLYSKASEDANPYYGILFDKRGRMSWGEESVNFARQIISVGIGAELKPETLRSEFNKRTDRNPDVLTEYWKRCKDAVG